MNQTIQSSQLPKRVLYQVQARRVERQDEASWFDMEEVRPMSRKASSEAVSGLNKAIPAFVYSAIAV